MIKPVILSVFKKTFYMIVRNITVKLNSGCVLEIVFIIIYIFVNKNK